MMIRQAAHSAGHHDNGGCHAIHIVTHPIHVHLEGQDHLEHDHGQATECNHHDQEERVELTLETQLLFFHA